jgi:hypothetical protein
MKLDVTEMHLRSSDCQMFNPSFLGYREISSSAEKCIPNFL